MDRYLRKECHKCVQIYFVTLVISIDLKWPPLKLGQSGRYQYVLM